jgi:hypothetical protein
MVPPASHRRSALSITAKGVGADALALAGQFAQQGHRPRLARINHSEPRRRPRRSRSAGGPSCANGGFGTAPSPAAWRKPAATCSPSRGCPRASGERAHHQFYRTPAERGSNGRGMTSRDGRGLPSERLLTSSEVPAIHTTTTIGQCAELSRVRAWCLLQGDAFAFR